MGSSGDVVIRAEGLGKKYTIKHEQSERYTTIRDSLSHQARALGRWANPFTLAGQIRRLRRHAAHEHQHGEEDFWALKDVSFEIRRGERVGIIGRNGAGKSTLLKILSRITEPTTGRVEIHGRVASLLEVGTGFHPELTGRENIYLNGAILGMTRREIRTKFDEIVDFAEVEKFLDTPVKRYSSGMYVRLAFAVAAHLEPEILVVDEVLAVGDALFQEKCLGKLSNISTDQRRTVLFVSHNMQAIKRLCQRCILLSRGIIYSDGDTVESMSNYLNENKNTTTIYTPENKGHGIPEARLIKAELVSVNRLAGNHRLSITLEAHEEKDVFYWTILIASMDGIEVAFFDCRDAELAQRIGLQNIELSLSLPLSQGTYYVSIGLSSKSLANQYSYDSCLALQSDYYPPGKRPQEHKRPGFISIIDFAKIDA